MIGANGVRVFNVWDLLNFFRHVNALRNRSLARDAQYNSRGNRD